MESFRGDLAKHRLSFLMPALLERRLLEGILRVERGAVVRQFVFRDGCLVFESSNAPREHLAQVLTDLKVLDATLAASAFESAHESGVPLGELLVERRFVDRARLIEAMEHKAREAFFDCYTWEAGELAFDPVPAQVRGIQLQLKAGPLHRDAMARLREWNAFGETFPDGGTVFDTFRECMVDWGTEAEAELVELAERGATLAELLASSREGPHLAARRLLTMYRRGVLSPRRMEGERLGTSEPLGRLLERARAAFHCADFEAAAAFAAQALDRAPVAEAHLLYRQAEAQLALSMADRVLPLEGRLVFGQLPHPVPPQLTADDVYLFGRLRSARSVHQGLRGAAMGELGAWRSLQRLMDAGLLWATEAPSTVKRRRTEPQFTAA